MSLSLLDVEKEKDYTKGGVCTLGEVKVTTLVKMFKKMKLDTGENLGFGPVRLPETDMHTTALWWTLPDSLVDRFDKDTLQGGMLGVANLMRIVAPLYLMCSPRDVAILYQVKSPVTDKPTLFLYDNCPGGIGLSEKAYVMQNMLLTQCLDIVTHCTCDAGCPSCAGPVGEIGETGKQTSVLMLRELIKCP